MLRVGDTAPWKRGVYAVDELAVALVGLLKLLLEKVRLAAVDISRTHEVEDSRLARGVDLLVGIFGEEDTALEGGRSPEPKKVPRNKKFVDALDDVEVAECRAVETHLPHFVGDARRRPPLPVVGEEGVHVHVHRGDLLGESGRGRKCLQRVDALPGVEGGELVQQAVFHCQSVVRSFMRVVVDAGESRRIM